MCRCIIVQCQVCGARLRAWCQAGVKSVKCPCCEAQVPLERQERALPQRAAAIYGPVVGAPFPVGPASQACS
jgi:hypothetical protein